MSLQVWLPLNGNLNNQGLLSTTVTSSTSAYNTSGKIGQCYNNTTSGIKVQYSHFNTGQLSLTVWVKPNSPAPWADIFSIGQYCNRLEKDDGTGYYWYTNDSSKALIATGTWLGISLTNGVWYHIAVTIDGATTKIYVNGSLSFTATQPNKLVDVVGSDSSIYCGARQLNNLSYASYLNDFRIYDHCLSPMEVKEISKGLVCHYKLSGPGGYNLVKGSMVNLTNTEYMIKSFSLSEALVAGNKYSITIKSDIGTRYWIGMWLDAGNVVCGMSHPDENGIVKITFTCPTANNYSVVYIFSGTTKDVTGSNGETVTLNYIKIEKGSLFTPWCPNSADVAYTTLGYNDTKEYDCSGFGNNATKTGTINWSSDSRRYSGSYDFNGTGYIKNSSFNFNANQMTISLWVKIPDTITSQHFLFGTFNNWTGNGIGYWRDVGFKKYSGIVKSNAESSYGALPTPDLTPNTWYHLAIVYTGTICILYVNGAESTRITYGSNGSILNPTCYVGNSLYDNTPSSETDESSVSDFRIYATPLSAQDIKSLYQTAASVSKSGVMAAYEFVEE